MGLRTTNQPFVLCVELPVLHSQHPEAITLSSELRFAQIRGPFVSLLNGEYKFYLSKYQVRLNSIKYKVVSFFNIVFLLSIKLFVFYMLKINILIISRKQFV